VRNYVLLDEELYCARPVSVPLVALSNGGVARTRPFSLVISVLMFMPSPLIPLSVRSRHSHLVSSLFFRIIFSPSSGSRRATANEKAHLPYSPTQPKSARQASRDLPVGLHKFLRICAVSSRSPFRPRAARPNVPPLL